MKNIFLDTNILMDIAENRKKIEFDLSQCISYISPLSLHILCYTFKKKIPNAQIIDITSEFNLISLSDKITKVALLGPTTDFEDNVQLHSATEADADYFITEDKGLLKIKFFGKTQIVNPNEIIEVF